MPGKLATSIEFLKGVGPAKSALLQSELNIFTFGDLLIHYPFRYIDRSKFYRINEIDESHQFIQLKGVISAMRVEGAGRKKRLIATFQDETGQLELIWFQGIKWITQSIKRDIEYIVFGKPSLFKGGWNIAHPEMELAEDFKGSGPNALQPVYSTTDKLRKKYLDSRGILKLQRALLGSLTPNDLLEVLPSDLIQHYKFIDRFKALQQIHFPADFKVLAKARARLKFEEFFFLQLNLLRIKGLRNASIQGFLLPKIDESFDRFYHESLPFELTGAQKKVIKEIRRDVLSGRQMNRLLQGDVGSGKTIVSVMTMLMAIDNGYQACLMAPTEILAQQHFATISESLSDLDVEVVLLTGSTKGAERKDALQKIESGDAQIVIGTHALIESKVVFRNLGMAVIDEQHRFGVAQRARLWRKNENPPHILVMTATPIPRTLAMTVYGDLDVSVIDELPPGRKPIKTIHRFDSGRLQVFGSLKREIEKGRQVYVVYPLIEESAKLDHKDLMDGYESISRAFPPPEYQVGILHGRMKTADKEFEMDRFVKGETQILVATTVIEVGVNVPNASVMVIESAERFGLSQLHQLRGRVGRGAEQSFCILMTGMKLTKESRARMKIMCETNDGFRVAEEDLKLRGPGDLDGTQQSGQVNLRLRRYRKGSRSTS